MSIRGSVFNIQKFCLHDGPGIRTVVFFSGCPLSCYWCSNPHSQKESRLYTVSELIKICLEDKPFYDESGGGVTLSGGEVLGQSDFALELLDELGKLNIHRAIETSGYVQKQNQNDIFEAICKKTDLIIFDIKHYDEDRHIEGCGVSNKSILANLKSILDMGKPLLTRIPVIPGFNDKAEDAKAFALLLEKLGLKQVELIPFHQLGEKKYELLGLEYKMKGIPQLHPEKLQYYRQVFLNHGMECLL